MALVIDALDLLYTDRPDAYGLVSSDADFTPLVMHLKAKGAAVWLRVAADTAALPAGLYPVPASRKFGENLPLASETSSPTRKCSPPMSLVLGPLADQQAEAGYPSGQAFARSR